MKTLKTPPLFYTNPSFLYEGPWCGTNRDSHTLYQQDIHLLPVWESLCVD